MDTSHACNRCLKPSELCVCEAIPSLLTGLHVLILQHPQEPDKELGSAHLAHLALPNSTLKVGLSWPNLKAALGREVTPAKWGVLYLGSGAKAPAGSAAKAPGKPAHGGTVQNPAISGPKSTAGAGSKKAPASNKAPALHFVDKKGVITVPADLEGIVILDGTWSQAKALWWRNAWFLKLKRLVLDSPRKSLYRELRREPRKECLSTIESIAEALVALGEPEATGEKLRELFGALLEKKRKALADEKARRATARNQKA